jgi:hypothetical protein
MAAATHPYRVPCALPSASAAFGLLVDGALERIGLARSCLERGTDPGRHLRTACAAGNAFADRATGGTVARLVPIEARVIRFSPA